MNERAQWRHRRLVIVSVVVLGTIAGSWWCYQQFVQWATRQYGIKEIHLSYTDVYDENLSARIDQWFEQRKADRALITQSRQELIHELMEMFPLVRGVSWGTYLPGHLHCTVTGVKPTFVINREYVAGNNGKLYARRDFATYKDDMPVLNIGKNWLHPASFGGVHKFFSQLPSALLSTYNIYYHDPYTIALVPVAFKELAHRSICLVDENSASHVRSLDELMELCGDLKQRTQPREKDAICFFDFRFQDRIISRIIPRSEFEQLQRVRT